MRVLDHLGEVGLKLKTKKCQLFCEEIAYLWHIVLAKGIRADSPKCEEVRAWPVPRDLHDVRLFVGLCSYYRRKDSDILTQMPGGSAPGKCCPNYRIGRKDVRQQIARRE